MKNTLNIIKKILTNETFEETTIEQIIAENPRLFKFVKNPSLGLQIIGVKLLGSNIQYIEEQNQILQRIAIDEDIENIRYIKHPTAEIEEFVVKNYPEAISLIENPREISILTACNYPELFKDIKNKSAYTCEYAVKKNAENIQYVKSPSIDLQRIAYNINPKLLSKVDTPDSGLIMEIIPSNPMIVKDINASMIHYKMAIKYDPRVILYLSDDLIKELLPYTKNVIRQLIPNIDNYTEEDVRAYPISILALDSHPKYREFIEIAFDEEYELIKILHDEVTDEKLPYILANYGWFLKYLPESKHTDMNILLALSNGQEYVLEYVKNPGHVIQKYAVEEDVNSLRFIEKPYKDVIDIAISKSPFAIRHLKNASEFICTKAIRKDANCIQFIEHQTERMQKIALNANVMSAKYFKNPTTNIKTMVANLSESMMEMEQFRITLDDLKSMNEVDVDKLIAYADIETVKEFLNI